MSSLSIGLVFLGSVSMVVGVVVHRNKGALSLFSGVGVFLVNPSYVCQFLFFLGRCMCVHLTESTKLVANVNVTSL
jgi:hypothetical protein